MSRRPIAVLLSLTAAALVLGIAPATATPPSSTVSPVFSLPGFDEVGSARLTRSDSGLAMTLSTSGLPAGEAVTVWWVIFNTPAGCDTHPCGEPDLFNPAANASVQQAAGHIIGGAGTGNFAGHLSVGDTSGAWPLFTGPGIVNPWTAEIWLVVHQHGPAVPGQIPSMIHTFGGGCANLPPFEGPNDCASTQVAIYVP